MSESATAESDGGGTAASDIARNVVSVPGSVSLDQVAETMHAENVGSVLVTNDGDLAGIITDRQVALSLREGIDPLDATAAEYMTPDPATIDRGETVFSMLETMKTEGVRRLPVVDEDGDPVSVVSLDDALVVLGDELGDVSDLVDEQV